MLKGFTMLYIKFIDITFFYIDPGINFLSCKYNEICLQTSLWRGTEGRQTYLYGPKIILALVSLPQPEGTKNVMEQNLWLFKKSVLPK